MIRYLAQFLFKPSLSPNKLRFFLCHFTFIISVLVLLLSTACSGENGKDNSAPVNAEKSSVDKFVPGHQMLRHFREQSGKDRKEAFDTVYAYLRKRQLAGRSVWSNISPSVYNDLMSAHRSNPNAKNHFPQELIEMIGPENLLTKDEVIIVLGDYDAVDDDGRIIYYLNSNKSFHIYLQFQDGYLFHTGYRQRVR